MMRAKSLGRLPVSFGKVEAAAGVVERGDLLEIAFRANLKRLARVKDGSVDGRPVAIVTPFAESQTGAGLVEASVRYVEEDAGND